MRRRGFTLLEILAVVALIALLATLTGPHIIALFERGQVETAVARCRQYHDLVVSWRLVGPTGRYPRSLEEMEAPLAPGEERFARIEPDPWKNPFRLEIDGRKVRVWSNGPDGEPGTRDDIAYVPPDE